MDNHDHTAPVTVRYFAGLVDLFDASTDTFELPGRVTVGAVRTAILARRGAEHAETLAATVVLVGGELVRDETAVVRASPIPLELDVMPPFAGG